MAKNRYKRAKKVFPIGLGPGDRAFEPHYSDQLVASDISLATSFFIKKLIVRSFCCSSLPNATHFVGLAFGENGRFAIGISFSSTRGKIPLKSTISEGFSYSLSIAAQGLSLSFSTYLFDKRRLNIVIFAESQYN